MKQEKFKLSEWFKSKLDEEKNKFKFLDSTIKKLKEDLKSNMDELKDDSHYVVPIINGLHGDSMFEKGHKTLINISFRHQTRDIPVEKLKEIYDFEKYQGRIIIMVHGLMNDESIWQSGLKDSNHWLGTAIEKEQKAHVLYVRYNTGLHISQNGRFLSNLLQEFKLAYEQKIKEITIICHSMGGLVTRSACHYAGVQEQDWINSLRKIFLIGVPNEGSYLARIAYMTQYFFRKIDTSENDTIAKFFDVRSNGIKDLSFGYLVDEDWQNESDGNEKNIQATKIHPLPNVDYYLIAATVLDENSRHTIFTFFGDGLVEKTSAMSELFKNNTMKSGKVDMKLFPNENHLTLLASKEVFEYIKSNLY